jgi:cell division protein FtsB
MKAPLSRFAYAVAFVLVATYAYLTLHGTHGLAALYEKRAQIRQLEKRNAGLAQEIERKREHIRRLAENPAEQELEIRERLKLAHPNEKIYIIGEPSKK